MYPYDVFFQEDIYYNVNEWEVRVHSCIRSYPTPTINYIGDKYDTHKQQDII